jgi:hypothetical protein
MSTKYKDGDTVPTAVLANRLKELSDVVAQGPDAVRREFVMRVPAERDRDADLVLSDASRRLMELKAQLAEAQADTERLEFLIREGWYEYDGSDWRSEIDKSIATSQMGEGGE